MSPEGDDLLIAKSIFASIDRYSGCDDVDETLAAHRKQLSVWSAALERGIPIEFPSADIDRILGSRPGKTLRVGLKYLCVRLILPIVLLVASLLGLALVLRMLLK